MIPFFILAGAGIAAWFVADSEMEEQKEFVREIAKETEIVLQVDNLEVEKLDVEELRTEEVKTEEMQVEKQVEMVEPETEEMPELE